MARPYRLQAEGCFYHITSRGDGRKKIFLDESDYLKFLKYLQKAKERYGFYLYAYCLMGNHYHLLIEITQPNLSRLMQYINTAYTVYCNVKRNKSGHLFQGRFKSILVEADSYFAELTRYMHLNPARTAIAADPVEYRWSSYAAYIHNKSDALLDLCRAKELLAMDLKQYRKFVEDNKDCPDPLKNIYAGFMLGGASFIKNNLNQLKHEVESKDFAHKRAIRSIIEPEAIINAVANYFRIPADDLRYSKERPQTAKRLAIYLLRKKTGLTNVKIGDLFRMKHSAVSIAALSFEKKITGDKKLKLVVDKISWKFEV